MTRYFFLAEITRGGETFKRSGISMSEKKPEDVYNAIRSELKEQSARGFSVSSEAIGVTFLKFEVIQWSAD